MTEAKQAVLQHTWDRLVGIGATLPALIMPLELIPGFWKETPLDALEALVTALFALDEPRSAGVRAAAYGVLYRLDRAMFSRVLTHYPRIAERIQARVRERRGRSRRP